MPGLPEAAGVSLDGVVALESAICDLGAEDGRLRYRGYDAAELAAHSTFEETAFLLLRGELPNRAELRDFEGEIKEAQKLTPVTLRSFKSMPGNADPMLALRVAMAVSAAEMPVAVPPSPADAWRQGIRLIAQTPTMVAAFHRLRRSERPVAPRKGLRFAANFLQMLSGTAPEAEATRAFDTALILRAENELNPSTFAARVAAATGADVYAAVAAATAALGGPRHGWHSCNVMRMLEEVGTPEAAAGWVRLQIQSGKKIPGFGHQVYQGEDPRTALLRPLVEAQSERVGMRQLFRTARAVEEAVRRDTGQHAIVDFYLAPLYRAVGIPTDLFTVIFAVSRMPGWVAHTREQYQDDRLIRPRAQYRGAPHRFYAPMRGRS